MEGMPELRRIVGMLYRQGIEGIPRLNQLIQDGSFFLRHRTLNSDLFLSRWENRTE
jgi:hypothetical protein